MKKLILTYFLLVIFLVPIDSLDVGSATQDPFTNTKSFPGADFNVSSLASDMNSNPYNISYSDWTAKWWQWAYSIPLDRHPSYDDTGKLCGENQKNPVWYLSNSWIFCCPNM